MVAQDRLAELRARLGAPAGKPTVGDKAKELARSTARGFEGTLGSVVFGASALADKAMGGKGNMLTMPGVPLSQQLTIQQGMKAQDELLGQLFPVDPRLQGSLYQTGGEALGSSLAFGAVGAPAAVAGGGALATGAAIGGIGSLAQFSGGYYDALQSGADPEVAFRAGLANAPSGLLEGIPLGGQVARVLGKVNKATGGALMRGLARAVVEGGENAAQELTQRAWQDVVAKHIAQYDEDRQILHDALRTEGLPSFLVGALLSGTSQAMQRQGQEAPVEGAPKEAAAAPAAPATPLAEGVPPLNEQLVPQGLAPGVPPLNEQLAPQTAQEAPGSTQDAGVAVEPAAAEGAPQATAEPQGRSLEPTEIQVPEALPIEGAGMPPAQAEEARVRSRWDRLYADVVNYLDPAEKAFAEQQAERGTGEPRDTFFKERFRKSRSARVLEQEVDPRLKAIRDVHEQYGITPEESSDFIKAVAAPVRNELIRKRSMDPETGEPLIDDGSGWSDEKARAKIVELTADPKKAEGLAKLKGLYDEMTGRFRQVAVESGDLSPQINAAIEATYGKQAVEALGLADPERKFDSYYAAFRTEPSPDEGQGVGLGMTAAGRLTRQATGRSSESGNVWGFAAHDLSRAIVRAGKLDSLRSIADEVQRIGKPSFARILSPGEITTPVIDSSGKRKVIPDPNWRNRPDVIPFKTADGEDRAMVFGKGHEYVASVLRGDTMAQPGRFMQAWSRATRWMAALRTRRSPEFFATNGVRDVLHSVAAAYSKEGPKFAKDVMVGLKSAWSDYAAAARNDPNAPADAVEYVNSGVGLSAMDFADYATAMEALQKEIEIGPVQQRARAVIRWIETTNDVIENATRLSVYRAALKNGKSVEQAANLARQEIGINFERKGNIAPTLGAMFAFANAGIQGNEVFLRALKSKNGMKAAMAVVVAAALRDQINRWVAGEDDDGENFYDKLDEGTKLRNAVFANPFKRGDFFMLPMPPGWNMLDAVGRHGSAIAAGAKDADVSAVELGAGTAGLVNFLGEGPPEQMLSPTVFDPFVQHWTNKNFAGRQIVPEDKYGPEAPAHKRYFRGTAHLPIEISKFMSEITATDDSGKGLVEVSPNTIEHFARALFGGLGDFVYQTASTAGELASGELPDRRSVPILRRLYGETSPFYIDRKYSENLRAIEEAKARYDELRKEGEGPRALAWRRENFSLFRQIDRARIFQRLLSKIPDTPENEDRRRALKARFNRSMKESQDQE